MRIVCCDKIYEGSAYRLHRVYMHSDDRDVEDAQCRRGYRDYKRGKYRPIEEFMAELERVAAEAREQ